MSTLAASLEVLQSGDFHARWDAAKALPQFGERAIAPLIEILETTDPELQWMAVRALSEFRHPDALMALATVLSSTAEEEVCQLAAETLGAMGADAIPALTVSLRNQRTALAATQALAQIRNAQAIPALLEAAQNPQVSVRSTAMEALTAFHRPVVMPALLNGLEDTSPQVRRVAVMGLGYQPEQQESHDLVAILLPYLSDSDSSVCQAAALALGRLGAAEPLLKFLQQQPSLMLCLTVIQALGQMGSSAALDSLRQLLTFPVAQHSQVLIAVVGAIASTPANLQSEATKILVDLLKKEQSPTLLRTIATALGQLGQPEAMDALIQLLVQADMGVKLHAIAALKHLDTDAVYHRLQTLAQTSELDSRLSAGITFALQEWQ